MCIYTHYYTLLPFFSTKRAYSKGPSCAEERRDARARVCGTVRKVATTSGLLYYRERCIREREGANDRAVKFMCGHSGFMGLIARARNGDEGRVNIVRVCVLWSGGY